MKLYIANCTKQVMDFHYRAPEQQRPMMQTIPIGGQIQIYKDTTQSDLEHIIEQHQRYGLVQVSEIDRTKAFIGACYQIDRPIDVEKIMRAAEHNDEVLTERGQEFRKEAAAALDGQISANSPNLTGLEVEIHEESKPGDNTKKITETISVERDGRRSRRDRR